MSDNGADENIVDVLTGDGHDVTLISDNYTSGGTPALQEDLSAYDAVYWSANGSGFGSNHNAATTDAVEAYAAAGGFVFVTGYDSIDSPDDTNLHALIGATGSRDVPGAPGPIEDIENVLTVGLIDIRGLTPSGYYSDRDAATGLADDTQAVVYTDVSTNVQYSTRFVGSGVVAYVSNGASGSADHESWSTEAGDGSGVYNAAVRNFAHNTPRNILFVQDDRASDGIGDNLSAAGHQVTSARDNFSGGRTPALEGDLSEYDVVFWVVVGRLATQFTAARGPARRTLWSPRLSRRRRGGRTRAHRT